MFAKKIIQRVNVRVAVECFIFITYTSKILCRQTIRKCWAYRETCDEKTCSHNTHLSRLLIHDHTFSISQFLCSHQSVYLLNISSYFSIISFHFDLCMWQCFMCECISDIDSFYVYFIYFLPLNGLNADRFVRVKSKKMIICIFFLSEKEFFA